MRDMVKNNPGENVGITLRLKTSNAVLRNIRYERSDKNEIMLHSICSIVLGCSHGRYR